LKIVSEKKMAAHDDDETPMLDSASAVVEIYRPPPSEMSLVAADQRRGMAYLQFRQFLDLAWAQVEADAKAGKLDTTTALPREPPPPRRS
jgi:hypothetical protein